MKNKKISRREFIHSAAIGLGALSMGSITSLSSCRPSKRRPNLIFVFADQWRAQATGYAGNLDVKTPNLDRLASESINFTTAVSGCSVCSPYRASLMTGQYPLTHGIFYNDKPLSSDAVTVAEVYNHAGYETAYIGKWHLDGHGRDAFIPRDRRQGFKFWKARECTHDYNNSFYYADENIRLYWEGYDAIAQTREAQKYIQDHKQGKPFALFLSWGPPHGPYQTAPDKYRELFSNKSKIGLRKNVPEDFAEAAREDILGYYAHIAALDDCIGDILGTLEQCEIEENTIFVFTSDHGDMLYSHGQKAKQKPWDESILVPFLLRFPEELGKRGRKIDMPINTPDIMSTLLGLCHIEVPRTVEGRDLSGVIRGLEEPSNKAALIMLPVPFHQWNYHKGGREYRGIRTLLYTYVEDLKGPWLLYDNQVDPYQLRNLCNLPEFTQLQSRLKNILRRKLEERNDKFLPGPEYMRTWGYEWDGNDAPSVIKYKEHLELEITG